MAVEWQRLRIPMNQGIETSIDAKHLPNGQLVELENARFDKTGTINKRYGHTAVGGTGLPSSANLYGTLGNSHILAEDFSSSSGALYTRENSGDTWNSIGNWHQGKVTEEFFEGRGGNESDATQTFAHLLGCPSHAVQSDWELYCWEEDGDIRYRILDSDGNFIQEGTEGGATHASRPKAVAVGSNIHVYYIDGTSTYSLKGFYFTGPSASATGFTVLGSGLINHRDCYDVAASSGTTVYVAYLNTSNALKLVELTATGGVQTAAVTVVTAANTAWLCALDVAADDSICVAYSVNDGTSNSNDLIAYIRESDLTARHGPTTLEAGFDSNQPLAMAVGFRGSINGSYYDAYVVWTKYPATYSTNMTPLMNGKIINTNNSTSDIPWITDGTTTPSKQDLLPASKPYWDSDAGQMRMWVVHAGRTNPTCFLVALGPTAGFYDIYAKAMVGVAQSVFSNIATRIEYTLPPVIRDAANKYSVMLTGRVTTSKVTNTDTDVYLNEDPIKPFIRKVTVDHSDTEVKHTVNLNDVIAFPGGFPMVYDGSDGWVELGFHSYPEPFQCDPNAGSGDLSSSATYTYRAVYERTLANGDTMYSTSVAFTATGSTGYDIDVPTLRLGRALDKVRVVLYRSSDGFNFFRVADAINDPTASHVTITDDVLADTWDDYPFADAELDASPPPATDVLAEGKGRLWGVDPVDQKKVFYTKLKTAERVYEWSDALTIRMPEEGGRVTALAAMGELMVVFKEHAIFYLSGEGPNNNGQGAFAAPQLVSTGVGCKDQRAVALTPDGLMFQDEKGFYLLARNLQLQFLSAPDDFSSQAFSSALVMEDRHEVRFLTTSGSSLIYDYDEKTWSADTWPAGIGAGLIDGEYHWAESDGTVNKESTAFLDAGTGYQMKATTGWIKLSELQGFMRARRVHLLGERKTDDLLRVRVAYDYDDTWVDTFDYDMQNESPMQVRFRLSKQKCQAIKLEITDRASALDATPSGEGYSLSEVALEVGYMRGGFRLGTANTVDEV